MPNTNANTQTNPPQTFSLNFLGDVMLGRLIDQLLPQHVHNPHDAHTISTFRTHHPSSSSSYTHLSPWGTALPLLHTSDLNLANLETAVTTSPEPWPHKSFNYRMHPANIQVLVEGKIDYVTLANNHTLDFGGEGLVETVRTLRRAGVRFSGAGEVGEECFGCAVLGIPRDDDCGYKVEVYSASDHPSMWAEMPIFHFIDYTSATRRRLKSLLTKSLPSSSPALKIFSVHWGPNYSWQPSRQIRSMAHFLIDECGVDIVHGHSAHHVQGVERYNGKLIIYGCGDFVDDYALSETFRNDLGGVWRVLVREADVVESGEGQKKKLGLDRLEIFPTRCERFRAMLLDTRDEDHGWVCRKIAKLSAELGTMVRSSLGNEGQIVIDLD